MKNSHIRILVMAFLACNLLLAVACGKESTKGGIKPSKEVLYGNWKFFDSISSGDFFQSQIKFKKAGMMQGYQEQDSLYFSANPGRGFLWEIKDGIVEGTRYLEGYRRESVRMLLKNITSTMYVVDREEDGETVHDTVFDTTMVVRGYFSETNLGVVDTTWTFRGGLKKLK